jgi:hypothetical protein
MKNLIALAITVVGISTLLADERSFAVALQRWERDRSLASLLHVATSGFFLVEDASALT